MVVSARIFMADCGGSVANPGCCAVLVQPVCGLRTRSAEQYCDTSLGLCVGKRVCAGPATRAQCCVQSPRFCRTSTFPDGSRIKIGANGGRPTDAEHNRQIAIGARVENFLKLTSCFAFHEALHRVKGVATHASKFPPRFLLRREGIADAPKVASVLDTRGRNNLCSSDVFFLLVRRTLNLGAVGRTSGQRTNCHPRPLVGQFYKNCCLQWQKHAGNAIGSGHSRCFDGRGANPEVPMRPVLLCANFGCGPRSISASPFL